MVDSPEPQDDASALLRQLRDLKRGEQQSDAESAATRQRWLEAVETLLRAIRAWMRPAVEEGLVRLDAATVHVQDDDAGAYDAPALKIAMPAGRIVWVRPVGTMQVGAQGIVDLVCGSSQALLVLNRAGVWKIRGVAPSSALVLLDGHAFSRTLGELIV